MRTLNPVKKVTETALGREVRAQLAAADVAQAERGRRPRRVTRWPVAVRRSIADVRLQRERTFWRAIARTTR